MKSIWLQVVFCMLFLSVLSAGQSYVDTVWVQRFLAADPYGYACHSSGRALTIDGQGSIYVFWQGTDWMSWSYCGLIKYSTDGSEIWVRYDLPGYLEFWEPINIFYNPGDNAVAITGSEWDGSANPDRGIRTSKFASDGTRIWRARFVQAVGFACDVVMDDSGNVYSVGSTGFAFGARKATIIRYNAVGTAGYIGIIDWRKEYTGTQSSNYLNAFTGVACDSSGYIYATGYCHNTASLFDWVTIKYNPFNGQTIWAKEYGGSNGDIPTDIVIGRGNYAYVAGHYQPSSGIQGVLVIKYDANGDTVWTGYYDEGSGRYFEVTEMAVDTSGNVYATGYVGSSPDYFVIKFSPSGNFSWVRYYNGPGNSTDQAWAIALDNSGNVYATGQSGGSGSTDYCTIKYDPNGNVIWVARYDGPGNGIDDAYDIAVDNAGFVYVTGVSDGGSVSGTFDCTTIKYLEIIVGIDEELLSKSTNAEYPKLQVYPNPFSNQLDIRYTIQDKGSRNIGQDINLTLRIYEISGRLVKAFNHITKFQSPIIQVNWDGTDDSGCELSAGIYFCRLQRGEKVVVKKLTKVR